MRACFVFAAIVLTAFPALAEDPPLPELTPEGEYRVMTQDDATSTSDCIGNPVTPLCAVETVMACQIRGDDDLCRIGMGLQKNPNLGIGTVDPEIYWIRRSEILTGRTLPWNPREMGWRPDETSVQAGDVRLDIVSKFCPANIPDSCETFFDVPAIITYVVRRQGKGWAVIDWRPPYENYPRLNGR